MKSCLYIKNVGLVVLCLLMLSACHNRNGSRAPSIYDYEEEYDRLQYKSIQTALKDGDVKYGMTYDEIAKVCGDGSVYRVNGVVRTVTYYVGMGGTTLYFSDAGRFYEYTESY